jgi:MoaA/NifB/PqqE/SkfB family radical SAM enzyme
MLSDFWKRLFLPSPPQPRAPIEPGIYHAMQEVDGTPSRFHLRVDNDGSGMLLVNATTGARLSPTGVLIARRLLDGADAPTILDELSSSFEGGTRDMMHRDLSQVQHLMQSLAAPGDTYPIISYENVSFSPYEAQLIAPLQANVPLAAPEQIEPILKRLWEVGVPHVTILAGPDPDHAALVRAIEHAEDLGMIAGVRGRGSDLRSADLLRDMALAGVDYVTLPWVAVQRSTHDMLYGEGDHPATREAAATLQEYEVCPVVEVPLIEQTSTILEETFDALAQQGIPNISLFAIAAHRDATPEQRDGAISAGALAQAASMIEETSYRTNIRYVWQPPILRNPALPLSQQAQRGPRCSGDVAVRVEPDGSVIPAHGPYRSAGNLLRDSWDTIWKDRAFRNYRERVAAPVTADDAPDLTANAADDSDRPD